MLVHFAVESNFSAVAVMHFYSRFCFVEDLKSWNSVHQMIDKDIVSINQVRQSIGIDVGKIGVGIRSSVGICIT